MTRTKALTSDTHRVVYRIALVAVFALLAFGYTSLTAHADATVYRTANGGYSNKPPKANSSNVDKQHRGAFSQKELDNIMDRIAKLEKQKQELMDKLEKQKNGKASSTPQAGGAWQDRFCTGGLGAGIPNDIRKRICDRWKPNSHSTSTPQSHASGTAMIKLQHPNAGTAYKHPVDGAVIIKWRNTTGDKTVDIDLKKGSTTTSIAKNVTGKRINENGDVLGVSTAGRSSTKSGEGKGHDTLDKIMRTLGSAKAKPGQGKNPELYGYRWKDAPIGDGYKIVLTVKDGEKTYTDESDKEFSVKKNPKGNNWYETDAATNGSVLGASTTAEMQTEEVLNYLEDTLAEISVALTSQ